jgi:cytochrome c oxidase assembly protein subunit 15
VSTLFLVVAGASVTSNEAGLSVPDWPLSYGQVMPPMTGGVFYEHGHRMAGATVGFLTIILAVWLMASDRRAWMKRLGWVALAAVITQGVLGGLTVLYKLPKPISITHACMAQLFFSLTVAFALFTSAGWREGPRHVEDSGTPSTRFVAAWLPVLVLAQVALGAAYRHRALGLAAHVVGALVVTLVVMMAATMTLQQFPNHRALTRAALAMLIVTMIQVFLGIAAYMSRISSTESAQPLGVMVLFTVLHVAVGAVTMASSVIFSIEARRNLRPAARGMEGVSLAS